MKKFATFLLFLSTILGYSATKQLTVNDINGNVFPEVANYQSAWYPVFAFNIPEGYTDFELKASLTNYGDENGEFKTSHDGSEIIYYYYSMYPYIGTSGIAPFQKFHEIYNQVYFTTSRATRYTYNGNFISIIDPNQWDPRKWIRQIPSFILLNNNPEYALYKYTTTIGSINSAIVIAGYDRNSSEEFDLNMKAYCKPTNPNLVWSILFKNATEAETDGHSVAGGGAGMKWRTIMPVYWVNVLTPKVGGDILWGTPLEIDTIQLYNPITEHGDNMWYQHYFKLNLTTKPILIPEEGVEKTPVQKKFNEIKEASIGTQIKLSNLTIKFDYDIENYLNGNRESSTEGTYKYRATTTKPVACVLIDQPIEERGIINSNNQFIVTDNGPTHQRLKLTVKRVYYIYNYIGTSGRSTITTTNYSLELNKPFLK